MPGVVRVLTAEDVPGLNDAGEKHDEPLFPTEVMFYGHAVCWVLGETLEAARQGAEAIAGRLRAAAVTGHHSGRHRGRQLPGPCPHGQPRRRRCRQWPTRAHRFTGEFEFGGQEHFYLETNAALALVDENGQVFVQSSTQHPSETQDIVAHVLGMHATTSPCSACAWAAVSAARRSSRTAWPRSPRWARCSPAGRCSLRLNRTQDITMTGKRHPFLATWEVGFDADNRICALRATLTSNGGWSLDLSEPVLARALCHIDNAYWIPDITVHGRIAKTNRTLATRRSAASAARRA